MKSLRLSEEQDILDFLARSFAQDSGLGAIFCDIVLRLLSGEQASATHFVPGDFGLERYFLSMRVSPFTYQAEPWPSGQSDANMGPAGNPCGTSRQLTAGSRGGRFFPALVLELDVPYEGKELASRLQRDYMIISNIPSIVTMFDMSGRVLHQNQASMAYMGHLVGLELLAAPRGAATPARVPTFTGARGRGETAYTSITSSGSSTRISTGSPHRGHFRRHYQQQQQDEEEEGAARQAAGSSPPREPEGLAQLDVFRAIFSLDPLKGEAALRAVEDGKEWKGLVLMHRGLDLDLLCGCGPGAASPHACRSAEAAQMHPEPRPACRPVQGTLRPAEQGQQQQQQPASPKPPSLPPPPQQQQQQRVQREVSGRQPRSLASIREASTCQPQQTKGGGPPAPATERADGTATGVSFGTRSISLESREVALGEGAQQPSSSAPDAAAEPRLASASGRHAPFGAQVNRPGELQASGLAVQAPAASPSQTEAQRCLPDAGAFMTSPFHPPALAPDPFGAGPLPTQSTPAAGAVIEGAALDPTRATARAVGCPRPSAIVSSSSKGLDSASAGSVACDVLPRAKLGLDTGTSSHATQSPLLHHQQQQLLLPPRHAGSAVCRPSPHGLLNLGPFRSQRQQDHYHHQQQQQLQQTQEFCGLLHHQHLLLPGNASSGLPSGARAALQAASMAAWSSRQLSSAVTAAGTQEQAHSILLATLDSDPGGGDDSAGTRPGARRQSMPGAGAGGGGLPALGVAVGAGADEAVAKLVETALSWQEELVIEDPFLTTTIASAPHNAQATDPGTFSQGRTTDTSFSLELVPPQPRQQHLQHPQQRRHQHQLLPHQPTPHLLHPPEPGQGQGPVRPPERQPSLQQQREARRRVLRHLASSSHLTASSSDPGLPHSSGQVLDPGLLFGTGSVLEQSARSLSFYGATTTVATASAATSGEGGVGPPEADGAAVGASAQSGADRPVVLRSVLGSMRSFAAAAAAATAAAAAAGGAAHALALSRSSERRGCPSTSVSAGARSAPSPTADPPAPRTATLAMAAVAVEWAVMPEASQTAAGVVMTPGGAAGAPTPPPVATGLPAGAPGRLPSEVVVASLALAAARAAAAAAAPASLGSAAGETAAVSSRAADSSVGAGAPACIPLLRQGLEAPVVPGPSFRPLQSNNQPCDPRVGVPQGGSLVSVFSAPVPRDCSGDARQLAPLPFPAPSPIPSSEAPPLVSPSQRSPYSHGSVDLPAANSPQHYKGIISDTFVPRAPGSLRVPRRPLFPHPNRTGIAGPGSRTSRLVPNPRLAGPASAAAGPFSATVSRHVGANGGWPLLSHAAMASNTSAGGGSNTAAVCGSPKSFSTKRKHALLRLLMTTVGSNTAGRHPPPSSQEVAMMLDTGLEASRRHQRQSWTRPGLGSNGGAGGGGHCTEADAEAEGWCLGRDTATLSGGIRSGIWQARVTQQSNLQSQQHQQHPNLSHLRAGGGSGPGGPGGAGGGGGGGGGGGRSRRSGERADIYGGRAWHEVVVRSCLDPMTSEPVILVVQTDVTSKVRAEAALVERLDAQHRLLADVLPSHVVTHMMQRLRQEAVTGGGGDGGRPVPLSGLGRGATDAAALATSHDCITVLFADIKGFTEMSKEVPPAVVMTFLNDLYTRFDSLTDVYGVYKVETIGDCYMVAGGLVARDEDGYGRAVRGQGDTDPLHAMRVVAFARAMLEEAAKVSLPNTGEPVQLRIGIHSGPATSGVVGQKMPRFCLFGDTVNTASRMESTGRPGAIHVSSATRCLLPPEEDEEGWEGTGGVEVKGKGRMDTFLWLPHTPGARRKRSGLQQRAWLLGTLSSHRTRTTKQRLQRPAEQQDPNGHLLVSSIASQ